MKQNPSFAIAMRNREGKPGGGKWPLLSEEVSLTLATINDQTLFQAQTQYGDIAAALTARNDGSPCADRGPNVVAQMYAVRRLTPVECERLQGFPDGWTQIAYKGKAKEDCPDGPRYKALGNSMAVPCMRWIGERIQKIESDA